MALLSTNPRPRARARGWDDRAAGTSAAVRHSRTPGLAARLASRLSPSRRGRLCFYRATASCSIPGTLSRPLEAAGAGYASARRHRAWFPRSSFLRGVPRHGPHNPPTARRPWGPLALPHSPPRSLSPCDQWRASIPPHARAPRGTRGAPRFPPPIIAAPAPPLCPLTNRGGRGRRASNRVLVQHTAASLRCWVAWFFTCGSSAATAYPRAHPACSCTRLTRP